VILGLEGYQPESIDPDAVEGLMAAIRETGTVRLLGSHPIAFDQDADLTMYRRERLPFHANGMRFTAYDTAGAEVLSKTYYSVGGGFVVDDAASGSDRIVPDDSVLPYPFRTGDALLALTEATGLSISALMLENEKSWRPEAEVRERLLHIWAVMQQSIERGSSIEGTLPGGLKVRRRAADLKRQLLAQDREHDPLRAIEWVTLCALAVNEENGRRRSHRHGAHERRGGDHPGVLSYYTRFVPGADDDGVVRFMLAAGAVGMLFKENASISGAEVGCQGEVGQPARWRRPDWRRSPAAPRGRSRTRPRSGWSTTSGSPATRSGGSSRSPASSATRSRPSRRSPLRGWPCTATASTTSRWTR